MYHEKGYFFAHVKIDTNMTKAGSVNVLIRIKEGKKVDIEEIRFKGNRSLKSKALKKVMQTQQKSFMAFFDESGIYKKDVLKLDLLRLEAYYQDQGFYRVRVLDPEIDVNKKEKRIYITIPVQEGIQYKVNIITAKGDDSYTEEEILSVMRIKKGDIFNVSRFREDERRRDPGYQPRTPSPRLRSCRCGRSGKRFPWMRPRAARRGRRRRPAP